MQGMMQTRGRFLGAISNPQGLNTEQTGERLAVIGSNIKSFLAGAINCAGLLIGDAVTAAETLPEWRQNRKGIRQEFRRLARAWEEYLAHLLYDPNCGRFFDPEMLSDSAKKSHGYKTRAEMFEFWQLHGLACFCNSRQFITSLTHKIERRAVQVGNDEKVAHAYAVILTADYGLRLAHRAFNSYCLVGQEELGVPMRISVDVFRPFDVLRLVDRMARCIDTLAIALPYETDEEAKTNGLNVRLGMEDLERAWFDKDAIAATLMSTIEEGAEFFRTQGEHQKAIRELREKMERYEEINPRQARIS